MRIPKYKVYDRKFKMMFDVVEMHLGSLMIKGEKGDSGGEDYFTRGQLTKRHYNEYRYELLQYIGCQDSKGNEIYEGNIVKQDGRVIGYVAYSTDFTRYCIQMKTGRMFMPNTNKLEVIGNIYEHSHLLEETA